MAYPTSVDSGAAGPKTGLAQISGGATEWGVPGTWFTGQNTWPAAANSVVYVPVYVTYTHTLTAWECNVTVGPAGAANLRVGVYQADANVQPVGAPLYDSGAVAVGSGFTGLKTATGLSIALVPGMYLVCINVDTAMTLQGAVAIAPFLVAALSATPIIKNMTVAQTFGAFPTPGTAWTAATASSAGTLHTVAWQCTE